MSLLDESVGFYERVFGATLLPKLTHNIRAATHMRWFSRFRFQPMVALWIGADSAKAQAGYDFLTLAVEDRAALHAWSKHLDDVKIEHSDVLTAETR